MALSSSCPSDYLAASPFPIRTGSLTLLQDIYFNSSLRQCRWEPGTKQRWPHLNLAGTTMVEKQNQTQLHYPPNSENTKKKNTINSCFFFFPMVFSITIKQWCLENGLDLFGQQKASKTSRTATSWLAAETEELSVAHKSAFSHLG